MASRVHLLRRNPLVWIPLAGLLALLISGCGAGPQSALAPAGPVGMREAGLYNLIFWMAVVVFVLVEGLLLFTALRFRRRTSDGIPSQIHGNTRLEIVWTIIPVLILIVIAVPTITTIASASTIPQGPDVLKVTVIGHQWWWEFRYPDLGIVTADEMHIPVGTKVALTVESADVIHSFWVPRLAGKIQAIPRRQNEMWLQGDEIGEFYGQCYQLCGTSHANMRFRVFVQSKADFDAWVKDQQAVPAPPTDPEAAKGAQIFQSKACVGCHTIAGTNAKGTIGPNLTHFGSRTTIAGAMLEKTDANLAMWLHDPPGVKPGSIMPNLGLTDDEIKALVAYLDSLK